MKKPRKRRRHISFEFGRVFPADDALAIDLLRLMAFHDDLSFVGDFMRANLKVPVQSVAKQVAASRFFFLQRLFGAILAELVKVLQNMQAQPRFKELEVALDAAGRQALEGLLSVPYDKDHEIYGPLYRARNKAGFHFDPGDFATAIHTLLQRFGADAKSSFAAERGPEAGSRFRTDYSFADQIALEISFGLSDPREGPPPPHAAFKAAIDLHAALSAFLESAIVVYCGLRNVPPKAFKITEH